MAVGLQVHALNHRSNQSESLIMGIRHTHSHGLYLHWTSNPKMKALSTLNAHELLPCFEHQETVYSANVNTPHRLTLHRWPWPASPATALLAQT